MPLPVGSAPIPAGWEGVEERAGAIYIFRSGWIKPTEEMCRESLSLLHTLFRKLELQSISHLFFSPGCWWLCSGEKMHGEGEVHGERAQAPAHRPGSAQPLFVGGARTLCSSHGAPMVKVGRVCVLASALVSQGSRCCPELGHSSIRVMHRTLL